MFWVVKKEVPECGSRVSGDMCVRNTRLREKLSYNVLCYKDEVCKQGGKREVASLETSGQTIGDDNWNLKRSHNLNDGVDLSPLHLVYDVGCVGSFINTPIAMVCALLSNLYVSQKSGQFDIEALQCRIQICVHMLNIRAREKTDLMLISKCSAVQVY